MQNPSRASCSPVLVQGRAPADPARRKLNQFSQLRKLAAGLSAISVIALGMAQAEPGGLWAKDDARPPWFKPSLFLNPQFDAEAVIRDMRRFVRLLPSVLQAACSCRLIISHVFDRYRWKHWAQSWRLSWAGCGPRYVCMHPHSSVMLTARAERPGCLQLFEVINEDYNDFVSLSTKLVNVEAAVAQFQAPLLDVQVRCRCCCYHRLLRHSADPGAARRPASARWRLP